MVSGVFGKVIFESGVLGTLNDLLESPQNFYRITVPRTLTQQPRVLLVDLLGLYTHTASRAHTHTRMHTQGLVKNHTLYLTYATRALLSTTHKD